ncbi:MAG TPA: hypothetical protein VIK99_03495 [Thermaerobacter sp.]
MVDSPPGDRGGKNRRAEGDAHDGRVRPVDGGVPGPRSGAAARLWGGTYGRGEESGTDYEATRQSTGRIRARHRLARGPGNPRLQDREGTGAGVRKECQGPCEGRGSDG